MRTNIDIDDELMQKALAETGAATKKAVVEEGLRTLLRVRRQAKALKNLDGIGWGGDEDAIEKSWSWTDDVKE